MFRPFSIAPGKYGAAPRHPLLSSDLLRHILSYLNARSRSVLRDCTCRHR
ncbi:MAG TPA: hypothetical protein IAA61_09010 [Candidatus Ornithomonoglobus merdipullorum]|uniref:F-box domain-containing protein n=1 Tax=Candidatus Ornithomonoglobus merdipullorum TaxID=2840895 RepID=A0A9D1MCE5_9FIRM|nr:hypothetical protein [Candidatus Ornithomonoglobus merdipullorum]